MHLTDNNLDKIEDPSLALYYVGWLRGTVVERRSLTGELTLSHARPAANG